MEGYHAPPNASNPETSFIPASGTAQFRMLGLPGQEMQITAVPVFADRADPRNLGGPAGLRGFYKATVLLSRPGFSPRDETKIEWSDKIRGDSHLAITKPAFAPPGIDDPIAIKIRADTPEGHFEFTGVPNEKGYLGKIESQPFEANGAEDARQRAYRALAPTLSNWSVHLDIPVYIFQIEVLELRNSTAQMTFTAPFWDAPFSVMPFQVMTPEFRGFASLYREALNSNSAVYRFLCLFRIIDGIQVRRRRMGRHAANMGTEFRRPQEHIPALAADFVPWLNAIFPIRQPEGWDALAIDSVFVPEARGRKIKHIVDSYLRPLRNEVSHALSEDSGEINLSVDEMLHVVRVNRWLHLTKCIARRMLKNEFPNEFLPYLQEDGSIASPGTDSIPKSM
ncbi:MAG TPA: methylamine utilization protein MauJ [Terriglobia bacterium]|nr:methylamine utilization protein MauJ [Terriglobia bacterium]